MKTKRSDIYLELSPRDTDVLKGIALMFLLFHHLFYIQDGKYDDLQVMGLGIVEMLGKAAKVCVPIFVFLSGYGLMAGAEKMETISKLSFYKKRFVKLYSNYWFMWLIFIPIGIFVFGITFTDVYGENWFTNFALDFFGLLNCFGLYGYNPTWWFYSCIIILYLLFPFMIKLLDRQKNWIDYGLFAGSILLCLCPLQLFQPIRFYMLTFLLGIYFRNGLIDKLLPPHLRSWQSLC